MGLISDAYYPTYRDLSRIKSAEAAAKSAYKMAGISPDKIQLAEVHECYAHQELMLYGNTRTLQGKARQFNFKEGHTTTKGR